ncbi:Hypothetical predicted protein [Pelobates cultripes]|uniref:Uncharacterized protein n=1 Tax=Pelobates cultripes TaxID=61616 RepID=A0AAD1W488_PELCU|nr:Hypothetical predicted protein [Pelobates cultripes]
MGFVDPWATRTPEEESELEWRDIARQELWYDALEEVQYQRQQRLPGVAYRLEEQMAWRIPLLGDQPGGQQVRQLEYLVERELSLDASYRALWWCTVQPETWRAEGIQPQGENYTSPGLLWKALAEDVDFGSPAESRYWAIFYYRGEMVQGPRSMGLGQDLHRLAAMERQLEMDYVELLNSCQPQGMDTEQENWLGDPDLPTYSWENAAELQK